ncbi:hypothetical protein [Novacetimonas cocois]|uniref:Uncharacterized protein n=1 Tax=Novacetimonas cocois TaxID=1747507 RepID=A0A365YZ63_9PROT|nr:hypothetical protein [Novacetimonas cocois]RBM07733.1 hypothetical protein NJLHNGOC_06840 [Novacetimonas cocois]
MKIPFINFSNATSPRAYAPVMLVLTAGYLIFELGFNARLLDITGGIATRHDITAIEHYGRLISGVALTIAIWGPILRLSNETYQRGRWVLLLLICSAMALMPAAYYGEKALVEKIVDHSTGEQRRNALLLQYVNRDLISGLIKAEAIRLDDHARHSPPGKAFLSILPLMGMSVQHVDQKVLDDVKQVMARSVRHDTGGSDGYVYNHGYATVQQEIQKEYNVYTDLSYAYARSSQTGLARLTYESALMRLTHHPGLIPPQLDFHTFARQPPIVAQLREALHIPDDIAVNADMTPDEYTTRVRDVMVEREVNRKIRELDYAPDTFLDGAAHAHIGREAMEAVIAPALALVFSAMGALVHMYKSMFYLLYTARMQPKPVHIIVAGVLFVCVTIIWLSSNDVTSSALFQYLARQMRESGGISGGLACGAIRWMIQAQTYFYPVSEMIRSTLGFTYGTTDM